MRLHKSCTSNSEQCFNQSLSTPYKLENVFLQQGSPFKPALPGGFLLPTPSKEASSKTRRNKPSCFCSKKEKMDTEIKDKKENMVLASIRHRAADVLRSSEEKPRSPFTLLTPMSCIWTCISKPRWLGVCFLNDPTSFFSPPAWPLLSCAAPPCTVTLPHVSNPMFRPQSSLPFRETYWQVAQITSNFLRLKHWDLWMQSITISYSS